MSDEDHGGLDGLAEAYEDADLERQWDKEELEERIAQMPELYQRAKAAPVGSTVECPGCGRHFKKRSYQQAFCSNKGSGNCKDYYWNTVDEDRNVRAQHFNR